MSTGNLVCSTKSHQQHNEILQNSNSNSFIGTNSSTGYGYSPIT